MREKWKAYKTRMAVWGIFTLVWWGLLYPELYFTESTCQPVLLENGQEIPVKIENYQEICYVSSDRIIISSRFLEWWKQKKESYLARNTSHEK